MSHPATVLWDTSSQAEHSVEDLDRAVQQDFFEHRSGSQAHVTSCPLYAVEVGLEQRGLNARLPLSLENRSRRSSNSERDA